MTVVPGAIPAFAKSATATPRSRRATSMPEIRREITRTPIPSWSTFATPKGARSTCSSVRGTSPSNDRALANRIMSAAG